METTTEKQIEDLGNAATRYDQMIKKIDSIIDFDQRRRVALIEERAQLNALRNILMPPVATTKAIPPLLTGGAAALVLIDRALQEANRRVDEENARIEERLRQQREWSQEHRGTHGQ